jgi:hypothetical protein
MTHFGSPGSGPGRHAPFPPLASGPLRQPRLAYTVRSIDPAALGVPVHGPRLAPLSGDVVLARVDHVGDPDHLDLATGRTCALFEGDEILVAYGEHLALEGFEAYLPPNLGPCHLVAKGGVAALVASACEGAPSPTRITPLGLLSGGEGALVNVSALAMPRSTQAGPVPPVIACVGTAADAGALQAVSRLIRGLTRASCRVGVARVTGVASGSERWLLEDAGAEVVADMTDLGHVSTATLDRAALVALMTGLVAHVGRDLLDVILLDLASPLCGADTGTLVQAAPFAELVDGAVISAPDATGAVAATRLLQAAGVPVIALSGTLARSPLSVRVAFSATGLTCLRSEELARPLQAETLFMDVAARNLGGTA